MKKRMISLLLALTMVLGMLPLSMLQVNAAGDYVDIKGMQLNDGMYMGASLIPTTTKPDGGYAYYSNGVLTLHNYDIKATGQHCITSTGDLTITLSGTNTLNQTVDFSAIDVEDNKLTINGSGKLVLNSKAVGNGGAKGGIIGGDITIAGGTLELTGKTSLIYANGNLSITGGSIKLLNTDDYVAVYARDNFSMSGGSLNILDAVDGITCGNANLSRGDIKVAVAGVCLKAEKGNIAVSGCDLNLTSREYYGLYAPGNDVTLQGSSFVTINAGSTGIICDALYVNNLKEYVKIIGSGRAIRVTDNLYVTGSNTATSISANVDGSNAKALGGISLSNAKYAYMRPVSLYLGGVGMAEGDYLPQGAVAASTYNPGDNYAKLSSNGDANELYLKNYSLVVTGTTAGVSISSSLSLALSGTNTITTENGDAFVLSNGYLSVPSGGNLKIVTTNGNGFSLNNGHYMQTGSTINMDVGGIGLNVGSKDVIIRGGELNILADNTGISCNNLTATAGKLDVKSNSASNPAVSCNKLSYSPLEIRASVTVDGEPGTYSFSNLKNYKRVVIATVDQMFFPAFTTQPVGGEITTGETLTITWETNFDPVKQELVLYDPSGQLVKSTTLYANAFSCSVGASAYAYAIRSYYDNSADAYIKSNMFYVEDPRVTFNPDWGKTEEDIIKSIIYVPNADGTYNAHVSVDVSCVDAQMLQYLWCGTGYSWYDHNNIERSGSVGVNTNQYEFIIKNVGKNLEPGKQWRVKVYLADDDYCLYGEWQGYDFNYVTDTVPKATSNLTVNCIGSINYTVSGQTVTVSHSLACKVGYLSSGKYVAITGTKNGDGSYSFTAPAGVTEVVLVVKGDVSGDGKINVGDTAKTYSHVKATAKLTDPIALFAADVTGDGKLNVGDTSKIYAHVKKTASLTW